MIGRVRLWSAYVLFFYVVTHLLNHALGLISLRVLEVGRTWFVFIWHNPLGQTVLYGALFTHFFLALWSLYRRRALTLSRWEWTQLVLGALIIPLGAIHVVGTRLAHELYGVEPGYPWVLGSLVTSDWTQNDGGKALGRTRNSRVPAQSAAAAIHSISIHRLGRSERPNQRDPAITAPMTVDPKSSCPAARALVEPAC